MLEIQNTAARSLTEIILVLEKVFRLLTWPHRSESVFDLRRCFFVVCPSTQPRVRGVTICVSRSYWMTDVESVWK